MQILDERFTFRIEGVAKDEFIKRCSEGDREPSDVLREIIDAFNEDRLTLRQSSTPKKKLEMYHES